MLQCSNLDIPTNFQKSKCISRAAVVCLVLNKDQHAIKNDHISKGRGRKCARFAPKDSSLGPRDQEAASRGRRALLGPTEGARLCHVDSIPSYHS